VVTFHAPIAVPMLIVAVGVVALSGTGGTLFLSPSRIWSKPMLAGGVVPGATCSFTVTLIGTPPELNPPQRPVMSALTAPGLPPVASGPKTSRLNWSWRLFVVSPRVLSTVIVTWSP